MSPQSGALNAGTSPVSGSQASTEFELIAGADPYFTNLNTSESNLPYLSQDLRVFTATPALNNTPIPGGPALADSVPSAFSYIQALLDHLNSSPDFTNPNGVDPFTTIFPDQGDANTGDSSVTPLTLDLSQGIRLDNNYNFAVARVRLRGPSGTPGEAADVRVFFRMFATQSNDTDYDPNSTYPSSADAAGHPGSPQVGSGNTTIPFFATGNLGSQSDYAAGGPNIQTLTIPDGQDSLWWYYGCFLNLYDPANVINGSQVQTYLAGTHHCLVAQIAYDDAPIPAGVSPLAWDQLAQRNLQVTLSDNPGPAATHRIPQTFDCRPSKTVTPPGSGPTVYPDELMIDWGNVPTGSAASLYWPQVLASDVLALADQFYSTNPLTAADLHTIQIPVTEHCLSYVPIPAGGGQNFAGLLTIELPLSVTSGQAFDVQVRRISTRTAAPPQPPPQTQSPPSTIDEAEAPAQAPAQPEAAVRPPAISWRYVVGTFQVRIPVTTGENILPAEESTLAIMKWRLEQIAPSDRWYPVLQRYIDYISARVDGLGGDAGAIPPSLTGYPPVIVGQRPEQEFTGKVCEVLFDCHGAFDGFVLEDCCRTRIFRSRERDIGQLALVACREQLTLAVVIDPARDDRICRLAIKR